MLLGVPFSLSSFLCYFPLLERCKYLLRAYLCSQVSLLCHYQTYHVRFALYHDFLVSLSVLFIANTRVFNLRRQFYIRLGVWLTQSLEFQCEYLPATVSILGC